MNPALAALAVATLAGAVLAVTARDVRSVVLGLLVLLLAAPLISDPWPAPVSTLVRIAAGLLAARLIVVGVRDLGPTVGTPLGWPTGAILAAGAAITGFASHGLGATGLGPPEAQAAGFGLIALAIAPLVVGRDVLRLGVGAVLLVVGATLVRAALDRPASEGDQLVAGILTVALGGAVAVIATAAGAAGGLSVAGLGSRERGRRPPEAHRIADTSPAPGPRPGSRQRPGPPRSQQRGPGTEPGLRPEPRPDGETRPRPGSRGGAGPGAERPTRPEPPPVPEPGSEPAPRPRSEPSPRPARRRRPRPESEP